MAVEIVLPRLGWTMTEGTLVEWLKQDGDRVRAGEILFTVESDKALNEVESFDTGILRIPPDSPPAGTALPVGTLLAYLLQPGEAAPFEAPQRPRAPVPAMAGSPPLPAAQPRPAPIGASAARQATRPISPRARRIAAELGIDWSRLAASGRAGRIVERDVRVAAARLATVAPGAQSPPLLTPAAPHPLTPSPSHPLTPSFPRRVIAQRLVESAHTAAAVTLTTEADATELVLLRDALSPTIPPHAIAAPTYNDLMLKLTAAALGAHPLLNASWHEDQIHLHASVHVGIAVDTDAGLVVPVIRDVPARSLEQIAAESAALIAKARAGRLTPGDLAGGTFTITNLGMYGIDAFTPILNLPQCAILGVGRILRKPAVYNDQIVPRHMMALSLTFDHRVVDGGPAARFLNTVREYVEQPDRWFRR